jgi:hypothetical protein
MNKFVSKLVNVSSALELAQKCIKESAFIEVMPLTDGLFEISVRVDRASLLDETYRVILRADSARESSDVSAFNLAKAAEAARENEMRVCFVGSHCCGSYLDEGTVEHVDMDEDGEYGFIIRPEFEDGELKIYKVEEWVDSDIVDQSYGSYSAVREWISDNHQGHCQRRYSMTHLCDLWNRLADVPVTEDGEYLDDAFLFFPAGAHVHDVWRFFEVCNPHFMVGEAGRTIGKDHPYRSL